MRRTRAAGKGVEMSHALLEMMYGEVRRDWSEEAMQLDTPACRLIVFLFTRTCEVAEPKHDTSRRSLGVNRIFMLTSSSQ